MLTEKRGIKVELTQ
jgi:hypothetical protein